MPMSLSIELRLPVSSVTTDQHVDVDAAIRNTGGTPLNLPTPEDETEAYTFELRDAFGRLVRRMNGATRQALTSRARVDWRRTMGVLAPGETWHARWNLSHLHLPLPEGTFRLRLEMVRVDDAPRAASPDVTLEVRRQPVTTVQLWRDAPLLDMTTLLVQTANGGRHWRQLSNSRPLAAEVAAELMVPGDGRIESAQYDYADATSFDTVFERIVVIEKAGGLVAIPVRDGAVGPPFAAAPLPAPGRLLYAWLDAARQVQAVVSTAGELSIVDMQTGVLRTLPQPPQRGSLAGLQVINGVLHALWSTRGGLLHDRIDAASGSRQDCRLRVATRRPLRRAWIDRVLRTVTACFHDAPHGSSLLLAAFVLDEVEADVREQRLPFRGTVTEVALGLDLAGRQHLIAATDRGRLFYLIDGRGPALLGRQREPWLPHVVGGRRTYLGLSTTGGGYRFFELAGRLGRPRAVDFESTGMRG